VNIKKHQIDQIIYQIEMF